MTFNELCEIKEDLWEYLGRCDKPIVMYGTGNGADKIINVMQEKGIELFGIFASDSFARDREFRGFKVKKYSDFCTELSDFIVIVSFASQRKEVLENIYRINSERELYAPDVPVFGDGLFDMKYFSHNKKRLKNVYSMLSDDISRNVFTSSIAFKLTGKIQYLIECQTDEDETYRLISTNLKNKNYIDIGAYNGDTVEKYTEYFGKDMKLFAFEPDTKNYSKMLERFKTNNIECVCYNAAAWSENKTLRFYSHSGRAGSAVKGNGEIKFKEVKALRTDSVINENIGFIKIDAEGTDLHVISGLEGIIKSHKPCLKIAAYHRNEDYFAIPEKVSEICDDFSLYMRHLEYVPGWDTDFIFAFSD